MPFELNLGFKDVSPIFWRNIYSQVQPLRHEMNSALATVESIARRNESLVAHKTGSISYASMVSLFALGFCCRPQVIVEVGTYLGRSGLSLLLGARTGLMGASEPRLFTCDMSANEAQFGPLKDSVIYFGKKKSTDMFAELARQGGKADLVFLDGRLQNVVTHHVAVGSEIGVASIPKIDYENTLNIGAVSLLPEIQKVSQVAYSEAEHEKIRMISIDSLDLDGQCTFVKIDVEGFESEVIAGMFGFLKKNRFPPVFFEECRKGKFSGAAGAEVEVRQAKTRGLLSKLGYDFGILGTNVIAQHPDAVARVNFIYQEGEIVRVVRGR